LEAVPLEGGRRQRWQKGGTRKWGRGEVMGMVGGMMEHTWESVFNGECDGGNRVEYRRSEEMRGENGVLFSFFFFLLFFLPDSICQEGWV